MDPASYINFNGSDWAALKRKLEDDLAKKIRRLVNSSEHDDSQELRGAIKYIESLLKLEVDAAMASHTR